jgi:hypothetical protein
MIMSKMPDWVGTVTAWAADNRPLVITGGVILGVLILSLVAAQVWGSYRGRSLSTRASIGFGIVQSGVAYVTITGVYEFWADKVKMPVPEAILIATLIEAVTWAAVGMIFVHGATPGSVGLGDAGPLFWLSTGGGGIMAIIGSADPTIALGRAVVVVLGCAMWYLRLRMRTNRATSRKPTRWRATPRQWAINRGWLIADESDVVQSPKEWKEMALSRAVRQAASGRWPTAWLGKRAIQRVMESGDVKMVRAAQQRYALSRVLQDSLTEGSDELEEAIAAARLALYPPTTADPEPAAGSAPEPEPTPAPAPPATPRRQRQTARPTSRTAAASAARAEQNAASLKRRAVDEAVEALRDGRVPTGKEWGERYDKGDEWGRLRLREAQKLVSPEVNGHAPEVPIP